MSKPRAIPFPAIILVTLLLQLATPGIAWADGETPPAEAQPAVDTSGDAAPTVAEILNAAPPGTEVLVVDPGGTPEPLATQEAAEAILQSDPEWCPGSTTPGSLGCTGSFATVDALLNEIGTGAYSGDGTIYFTTPDYATDDARISGGDDRLVNLRAITITSPGVSLLVPLEVTDWAYDVRVENLSIDLNTYSGTGTGLRVETAGAIAVDGTVVTGSSGDGAYLDNTAGTASVTVTDSTFTGNTWTGLDARSHGDITLTDVVATGQEDGAYLDASGGPGTVTVSGTNPGDSDFSGNALAGLTAKTADGDITISNVTADSNSVTPTGPTALAAPSVVASGSSDSYGIGLTAKAGGAIDVITSDASRNGGRGLWIEGTGPINLTNVTADQNGADGAYIHNLGTCAASPITVTVDRGTFTNNGGYGLSAVLGPNGTLTFINAATFGGNALGEYVVNLDPCPTCEHKEVGKPYNEVYVPETGTPPVPLDCIQYAGTIFIFPDGDRATLTCPVSGEATVSPVTGDGLPGALPAGRSFIGGASVSLTEGGQPLIVLDEGGYLTILFKIPEELKGHSLAILYWDPLTSSWVELPAYSTRPDGSPMVHRLHPNVTPDDLMYILGGVRVMGDSVKVRVTFGGTFVLVSR
jgi:hypothetical protein